MTSSSSSATTTKLWILEQVKIVNEGKIEVVDLLINKTNGVIEKIRRQEDAETTSLKQIAESKFPESEIQHVQFGELAKECKNPILIPGVIDVHVHFREPGLTHKATIATETKASVRGGITSFMDMPNTVPPTTTQELLEAKYQLASASSMCNYSFYLGVTESNLDQILKTDPTQVCGAKIFLCHSTGNMKANNFENLENVFAKAQCLLATHCEDDDMIEKNQAKYKAQHGEQIPWECHADIRSEEACYTSTKFAIGLANKYPNSRLHVVHLTTESELSLFTDTTTPLDKKRITCEVSPHHLWFDKQDYAHHKSLIKCNPSIKEARHKEALLQALIDDKIDLIATDHAPHTMEEKSTDNYFQAPSGIPTIQQSLYLMLEFVHQKKLTIEKLVQKMCHAPALCYHVEKRGFIREGYFADLVLVDLDQTEFIDKEHLEYKCKWTPFEGYTFHSKVLSTWVNGQLVYSDKQGFGQQPTGKRLTFTPHLH